MAALLGTRCEIVYSFDFEEINFARYMIGVYEYKSAFHREQLN